MDTKGIILQRLGQKKLGKKGRLIGISEDNKPIHQNLGYEIALEVTRYNGTTDFVLGRYDRSAQRYRIAFDPNVTAGPIKTIDNAYHPL